MNSKNTLLIGAAVIALLALVGLFWNYTETIKEKNAIERERIESTERMKEMDLQQARQINEAKMQADLEADRVKLETDNVKQRQTYLVRFRSECESQRDRNIAEVEEFINSCTRANNDDIQFCMNTPAYKTLFLPKVDKNWVTNCIDKKMAEIGLE